MRVDPVSTRDAFLAPRAKSLRNLRKPDGEGILRESLRATRRLDQSVAFFNRCPPARVASVAFAWYVTDLIPYPDPLGFDQTPLLDVCIQRAFQFLDANLWEEPALSNTELLTAYLAGLFQRANVLIEIDVRGRGEPWDMLSGQPLGAYLKQEPGATVRVEDPPAHLVAMQPMQIAAALVTCVLPEETLAALHGRIRSIVDPELE